MINVFIDTNVYLDFYHLSGDDLEELKKLLTAIELGEIKLYTTDQVIDEYRRNRESKIAASLKILDEVKLGIVFPRIVQEYDEYKLMQTEARNFGEHLTSLRSRLEADISSKQLGPDQLVEELFERATVIEEDDAIIDMAERRSLLRKPPGKNGSIGDAINWESLIKDIPQGEDLFIISIDGDFSTALDKQNLADYLCQEWRSKKESEAVLYKSLGQFFKDKYPGIKLANDLKRQLYIQGLASSSNFITTHRYVTKVKSLGELSDQEASDIFDAAMTNNQIYWLGEDTDVNQFMRDLLDTKGSVLDGPDTQKINELFPAPDTEEIPEIDFDDLPF